MVNRFALFISIYLFSFSCQSSKNKVENLFGDLYDGEVYSGYLSTKIDGNELFYIYTPSQNSPSTAPLMLWLNGGPGCSSLFGMLGEVGPVTSDNFAGELKRNQYSWNTYANMVFIEQPAGVGFSKASDPDFVWTDDVTAENLLYGVKQFLSLFPDLKGRPFYVSGESYAGVYIPFLAKHILEDTSSDKVNLQGVLIGNPLTEYDTDSERSMVEFGFWHGLITIETYEQFKRNCPHKNDELHPEEYDTNTNDNNNEKIKDILTPRNVTHKCNQIRDVIRSNFEGNDIYGIYRLCPDRSRLSSDEEMSYNEKYSMKNFILEKLNPNKNKNKDEGDKLKVPDVEEEHIIWPSGCGGDLTFDRFLNDPVTKEKLKVYDASVRWSQCADIGYEMTESYSFYSEIMPKYPNLNVWVFSGTDDGVLSTLGTMRWINKLGFTVETKWRQWKVGDQVSGYVQKYKEGLVIVTVKGAGHMVPQDQNASAFNMVNAFFKGELP